MKNLLTIFVFLSVAVSLSSSCEAQIFNGCLRGRILNHNQKRICVRSLCPPSPCYSIYTSPNCRVRDGRAFRRGNDVCFEGTISCNGYGACRIDICLRSGCGYVRCGDVEFKICYTGAAITVEARARICVTYKCNCQWDCCPYRERCDRCRSCTWTPYVPVAVFPL